MTKLVTYTLDDEVLVTTQEREQEFLGEWFASYCGRNIKDYDRVETKEAAVAVTVSLSVN